MNNLTFKTHDIEHNVDSKKSDIIEIENTFINVCRKSNILEAALNLLDNSLQFDCECCPENLQETDPEDERVCQYHKAYEGFIKKVQSSDDELYLVAEFLKLPCRCFSDVDHDNIKKSRHVKEEDVVYRRRAVKYTMADYFQKHHWYSEENISSNIWDDLKFNGPFSKQCPRKDNYKTYFGQLFDKAFS
jgi:hypothetical protein